MPRPTHPELGLPEWGYVFPKPEELLSDDFAWSDLAFPNAGMAWSSLASYAHLSEKVLGKANETHQFLNTAVDYPGVYTR